MSYAKRLIACAVASVLGHVVLAQGAKLLPKEAPERKPQPVAVRVVKVPPPVEPKVKEPPPAPEKPVEPKIQPTPRPKKITKQPPPKQAEPPPKQTEPSTTTSPAAEQSDSPKPVFGISMSSTSQGSSGLAMAIGDASGAGAPRRGPSKGPVTAEKASGPGVVEAHAVSKMPLPIGRCVGTYTDEARAAAIEGTVILDLVVGPDGRPQKIKVVRGLPHGLTQAAKKAVARCRFSPGEQDGDPVAVRIRAFKIRFVLREGL